MSKHGGSASRINPVSDVEQLQAASTHGVELLKCEPTRDNRDRDAQTRSRLARQIGDQRPRTLRIGSCCKHQDRDGLFGDQGQQLVAATALTNVDDRHRAGDWRDFLAQALQYLFGLLAALLSRQVFYRHPMLTL